MTPPDAQDADDSQIPRRISIVRKLQALAQSGLTYAADPYDIERYETLRALAAELLVEGCGNPVESVEALFTGELGYATPKVDVRAAVFQDGKLLLVRERSDGGWTLPGGWADAGESPSQAIVKEVREESGFDVQPVRLLAVLDRDRHGHPPLLFSIYKLFFQCDLLGGAAQASTPETDGVGFFAPHEIPPLSLTRVMPHQIQRMFQFYEHPEWPADFD